MSPKKVLITGGTGSLGRALIKRLKSLGMQIIVYSRDEGKQALYFGRDKDIIRVVGDVRDLDKLSTTFRIHKPDYVIHAAALKRVDDMEFHPDECVKTNVIGSQNVATAALKTDVEKCILISTDKACQPVNVYGSSKFIAERVFTNFDFYSESTIFSSVRYGNVIASRGSFIPLWMSLINDNKTVPVTDLECSRFLFTLDDAVDTVLGALNLTQGGEVFIPKIKSYNLETVLKSLRVLCDVDNVDYNIVNMRPGEKIHEDMLAITELDFTYEVGEKLLAVLPQYSRREHTYDKKYQGEHFNSLLHLSDDAEELADLIKTGIDDKE
jgi:UDP-N-acetylglucosamine 4,6-dehydratase|tara:strand:+ start:103 stop:1077 length:975 start_codon:yes stop_codon:yes gene_type:complete